MQEECERYYDSGDYAKASEEYLKCSKYCEILVKKTADATKKNEYYGAFEKFVDAAANLKKMKTVGVSETETKRERARSERRKSRIQAVYQGNSHAKREGECPFVG